VSILRENPKGFLSEDDHATIRFAHLRGDLMPAIAEVDAFRLKPKQPDPPPPVAKPVVAEPLKAAPVAVAIERDEPEDEEEEEPAEDEDEDREEEERPKRKPAKPGKKKKEKTEAESFEDETGIPFLLPFGDAPDEYDLDPWGIPYAKTSPGRAAGKIRANRSQKKKSKKWITNYRLTIDGEREEFTPRYLLIARTIAEREFWRESEE